jgi:hypothetical protein
MKTINGIVTDLRERRLWVVVVVLVGALVAVPILLSKKASNTSVAQLPISGSPASLSVGGQAITLNDSQTGSHPSGKARDPFTAQKSPKAAKASGTSTTVNSGTTAGGSADSTAVGGSSGSASTVTGGGSAAPTTGSTPTVPTTPVTTSPATTPATPAPTGLTATESYSVSLAITNPSGGFDTIDPLERLSAISSKGTPLLIELGVLKGGHRVLFVVQPGTVVGGGGKCTPGPIDCEILSLSPNQVERVSKQTSSGPVSVAQFSITAIKTQQHSTVADAATARRLVSAEGQKVLANSALSALSLFQYDPNVGAVLDLRNLTVGGN